MEKHVLVVWLLVLYVNLDNNGSHFRDVAVLMLPSLDIENLANIADRAGYTIEELLNYLGVKPQSETSDVNQIIKQIKVMPLSEVAVIAKATAERFADAAQTLGEEVKAS